MLVRLVPGSIPLEGRVSGGRPELTTSDIAACLAGGDNIGVMILLRRIAGDTSAHPDAYKRLIKGLARVAKQNKWKLTRSDTAKNLLNLCLYEYIHPLKCPTCRGTGFYRYKECTTCNGTTSYTLNDSQRAHAIGIHRSNYRRTWAVRHKQVTDYLSEALPDHESRVLSRLYKMLKSD